ncbi:hypothetical protein PCANC_23976 [Puccinia coronata f. sp. avenae]|uniref:Tyrosinase copper-binding domain-containing protein n=1 Tax=Puccinia coronata f. sp. avenae TaxID=200324 RepID=A0A2N5TV63_9BASI|nr:hypothetical protein PCANC_23976 [Puccinia coronata f. sp. avenae]
MLSQPLQLGIQSTASLTLSPKPKPDSIPSSSLSSPPASLRTSKQIHYNPEEGTNFNNLTDYSSEQVLLAAIKLESENGQIEAAKQLMKQARDVAGTEGTLQDDQYTVLEGDEDRVFKDMRAATPQDGLFNIQELAQIFGPHTWLSLYGHRARHLAGEEGNWFMDCPELKAQSGALPGASANITSRANPAGCTEIRVRREWRKFSVDEQTAYISAVKCLAGLPSKLLPGGDYRRYDDFENVHSRMRSKIHWIASFLPWHHNFMFDYERSLREECGYSGNLPRWDWSLDAADMTQSPVWSNDPNVGFGSNGRDFDNVDDGLDGGVVTDGAFANWALYYPEYHQLQRNYNLPSQYKQAGRSYGSQFFEPAAVNRVLSQTTYQKFALALEGTDPSSTGPSLPGPHSMIHVIIGGDISPTAYAANEYLWWRWQNAQRSTRLNAYGGPATRGSTRNDARLSDNLKFLGLSPDLSVRDTMDTSAAPYCYRYE